MAQSKTGSCLEAALNIGSGFVLSMTVWAFIVAPLFGYVVHVTDNLIITSIFTVTSFTRSYIWRRIFNSIDKRNTQ